MSVPSSHNIEYIAIPETVEVAIMHWWNSSSNSTRIHSDSVEATSRLEFATEAVKVALLSLATNPIVPSVAAIEQIEEAYDSGQKYAANRDDMFRAGAIEWQRRMFLKRVSEVPEEVKALIKEYGERASEVAGSMRWLDAVEMATKAAEIGKRLGEETTNADQL